VAETKRIPFDQPEGESEIVAGYFVEYSGMKFGMFFMGEYIELFVSSALLVTLFFGGYQLPFLHHDGITVAFGDTKLFEYKAQEFPTAPALENKGTLARNGLFDWRTVTTFRYSQPTWDVGLNWRYLPPVKNAAFVTDRATPIGGAGAYHLFGLTAAWSLNEQLGISGGVDNLFNRDPERVGAGQIQAIGATSGTGNTILNGSGSTFPAYYDVLGRRYFVNLKLRF